jgi:hypothetical protein
MTAQGWPFLVARGHRRGYSVLLAPGFLLDTNDYGFLEEAAGPVRDAEPPRVLTTESPRGRRVCLVWSEYPITDADLVPHTRDEHSRPLRLINGFVCPEGTVSAVSEDDLARARTAALHTYRRFLDEEDLFTIEAATPFPLRSALAEPVRRPATPTPPKPRPRLLIPLAAAAVIATATTAVIALASTTNPQQPPPACIPLPPATSTAPAAPAPAPRAPTTPAAATPAPCPTPIPTKRP